MSLVTNLSRSPSGLRGLVFTHFNDPGIVALENNRVELDTVGGGWTVVSGAWSVENSGCWPDAAAGRKLAFIDAGDNNVILDATLLVGSSCCLGLLFKYTDINNYFAVQMNIADQKVYLQECIGGSLTTQDEDDYLVSDGVMHRVWARASGNNLRMYVDGVRLLSYNSSNNRDSTLHGLFANNPGVDPGQLLDFRVEDLGESD